MRNSAALILGAGESKRFGNTKQLVKWKGKSLIRNTVEQAIKSRASKVFVVLGYDSKKIIEELNDLPVVIVENASWRNGMADSIKCGVNAIFSTNVDYSIIVSVADQPYLNCDTFNSLIETHENGFDIVASKYRNGVVGVPVIFNKIFRSELENLQGDEGAKIILDRHPSDLSTVDFSYGDVDVDKPSDLPME